MKQLRRAFPGGPLYAEDLNELFEEVQRLSRLSVLGGDYQDTPGGPVLTIRHPEVGFWARVRWNGGSGSGPAEYDWWEQRPLGLGEFEDDPFGRTGTIDLDPAYSVPPDEVVPDDSVVWLVRGLARTVTPVSGSGIGDGEPYVLQEWYFQLGTGGGGAGSGSGCTCSALPDGWTDLGTSCELDLIERTCFSDNTKGKRTTRICMTPAGFKVVRSPWEADTDAAPDPP